jgi:hypothetical protein
VTVCAPYVNNADSLSGIVHEFSLELARRFGQTAFVIPPSRLHEFEKKNIVPSIHRVCTLARVYNCSLQKILKLYGLPPQ